MNANQHPWNKGLTYETDERVRKNIDNRKTNMEISQEDKEKMNEIKYNSMLDKCIDKSYADIMFNPTGFVRGITTELKNDMVIIKGENYPIKPKKETSLTFYY